MSALRPAGDVEIEAIALLDAEVTTHRSGQGAIFQ
jgi:hypothetical protein